MRCGTVNRTWICQFDFGSWVYTSNEMNVTMLSPEIDMDMYQENPDLEIVDISGGGRNEFFYACCPDDRYPSVTYRVVFKTK